MLTNEKVEEIIDLAEKSYEADESRETDRALRGSVYSLDEAEALSLEALMYLGRGDFGTLKEGKAWLRADYRAKRAKGNPYNEDPWKSVLSKSPSALAKYLHWGLKSLPEGARL